MGLRFRKSVRLFPGVKLNVSGGRISTTLGVPGASLNVGLDGRAHMTLGIPGTGISYRASLTPPPQRHVPAVPTADSPLGGRSFVPGPTTHPIGALPGEIRSAAVSALTSPGLVKLKMLVNEAADRRRVLQREIAGHKRALFAWRVFTGFSKLFVVRLLTSPWIARFEERTATRCVEIETAKQELEFATIQLDFDFDAQTLALYEEVRQAYARLRMSSRIWDVTTEIATNRYVERTTAYKSVTRRPVRFDVSRSDLVKARWEALHFGNANGEDLRLYPGFVLVREKSGEFALVDIADLDIWANETRFIEEESVPGDAAVVGHTWKKANKDGSRDKRFNNNHQVPIARYGELTVRSNTGLNEAYMVSSADAVLSFGRAFSRYQQALAAEAKSSPSITPAADAADAASLETAIEVEADGEAQPRRRPLLVLDGVFVAFAATLVTAWLTVPEFRTAANDLVASANHATGNLPASQTRAPEMPSASPATSPSAPPPPPSPSPSPAVVPAGTEAPLSDKTPVRDVVVVRAQGANVRKDGGANAPVIKTARRGERFTVFGRGGDWVQIGDKEPAGWIHHSLIEPVKDR
ncbi:DUF4236 domain-containing protein [Azospirillum sp. RWY-5-1]|uniref:DUF4236 domain-containing protein n=1 Tax=Azospirillum oleiclasticum TaxID=2735135 RepID=A0ABX2T8A3_9PROT|nr:DUF4236 domain-containing protein [Azospirillum oleiclasticum]NYZ13374.1 DUF4236 domain-containing protein [Azospirillum oleiclasticum]NYZ20535.1 DUF4236 domain-containing protein [Azospirillum oleiclasticum]